MPTKTKNCVDSKQKHANFKVKLARPWRLWLRLTDRFDACRSEYLPIRRSLSIHCLPPEILAWIFVIGSKDDSMLPVTISHVCSQWRSLALVTPRLWRLIHLDYRTEMWKERMLRAKACTLDVKMIPYKHFGAVYPPDASSIHYYMYLISATVNRWRSLEIRFNHYAPFLWNAALSELCSRSNRSRAVCLRELTLVYPRNDDAKEFCLFAGSASHLTRLTVDGVRLTWLPSLYHNLTYLDYAHHGFTGGRHGIHEIISMLRISCRLTELAISLPLRDFEPLIPHPFHFPELKRITLPYLRTLRIRVEDMDIPIDLGHLLSLVHTPSLLYLHCVDRVRRRSPFPGLYDFLQIYPFPGSTQILSLEHGWYNDIMLFSLLNRLPCLKQIIVKHLHLPDEVFDVYSCPS